MRLICLITHGLGDYYYPLCILPSFMEEHGISPDKLKIYVDSIYFVDNSPYYKSSKQTGIKLIESITKNWEAVPKQYFGSGDFYGIKNRREGVVYENIKYDFIYYRLPQLKQYMSKIIEESNKQEETVFIYGPCLWLVKFINGMNVPINLSKRKPLKIKISPKEREITNKYFNDKTVLIQIRAKGAGITPRYYNEIINYCYRNNIKVLLLGIKNEMPVQILPNVLDLRESISVEQTMYLVEQCPLAILSSSMWSYHRLFFNKSTIINVPFSNNGLTGYFREDINKPMHLFLNCDEYNVNQTINKIKSDFNI
jgi:hypothetical protein